MKTYKERRYWSRRAEREQQAFNFHLPFLFQLENWKPQEEMVNGRKDET